MTTIEPNEEQREMEVTFTVSEPSVVGIICDALYKAGYKHARPAREAKPAEPQWALREVVGALAKAAVELAIIRTNLRPEGEIDFDEATTLKIAEDAWNACQGIETCDEEPIPELRALRTAAEREAKKMLPCGHPKACEVISSETGLPIYCGWCNAVSAARDSMTDPMLCGHEKACRWPELQECTACKRERKARLDEAGKWAKFLEDLAMSEIEPPEALDWGKQRLAALAPKEKA